MSRDTFLSFILIFMVGISLFLSYSIWSKIPAEQVSEIEIIEENTANLANIISPDKIIIHMGNSSHTVIYPSSPFYGKIWNYSRKTLSLQWSGGSQEMTDVSPEFFAQKKGFEVFFPTPLPANFLKQLFDIKTQDTASFDGKLINSYILTEDGGLAVYLKDTEGKYYKFNKMGDNQELLNTVNEVIATNPTPYALLPSANVNLKISKGIYVSLTPYTVSLYMLKNEKIIIDRLANKFFPDFSVTRRIEERDGAIIFTDGRRGLRIYPEGMVEYSFPGVGGQKKSFSFYDALNTAVEFINSHGGWPKGGYLSSFEITEGPDKASSYVFKFQVRIDGHPVINNKNYLTISVEGGTVKSFSKKLKVADREFQIQELISPIKALDVVVAKKEIKAINNIYPAYLPVENELKAVWVIKTSEEQIVVDGISSEEIDLQSFSLLE